MRFLLYLDMEEQDLNTLRYPVGQPDIPAEISPDLVEEWINTLEQFPDRLKKLIANLNEQQLDTVYRPGGWTVRQVVHHVSDSHHNSYTRFKWALTEDVPVIKAYFEDRWAALADSKSGPVQMSLLHLSAVHAKLVYLLRAITPSDMDKSFIHPESNKRISLKENIGIYAWHCNHHYAHIANLMEREGWA